MNSDGTLAKVTYLPGVVQHDTVVHNTVVHNTAAHEQAIAQSESTVLTENTVPENTLPLTSTQRRAENVSMNALTRRGRSRWELGELLLARELDPGVVEAELDRLERVGLIDDSNLAETIVRTQHERKGLGRSAILNELRRKRIDQSVIDVAMEQLGDDDEFRRAVELAERRANQLRGLDHNTAVRRLSGYLQRKGYASDTVRRVVLEALPRRSSGVSFS